MTREELDLIKFALGEPLEPRDLPDPDWVKSLDRFYYIRRDIFSRLLPEEK